MCRRKRKEEKKQPENRISQRKFVHEQALHCISEVMQCVRLTTSLPSVRQLSKKCVSLDI
jgi:hypothetical protein